MSGFRPIVGPDRTPFQQSLASDREDYKHFDMNSMFVGVVLNVYPADDPKNRTSFHNYDQRGYMAEATVLAVNTNSSENIILEHVAVPPPGISGLNNYSEYLPRPTTNHVFGEDLNNGNLLIDPYDLDGDWCVVGFIGGSLDQPFIVRWWPHPRNWVDPATSGQGNRDPNGVPKALKQSGRYFQRINGVEYVVTSLGDIYLSTTYANSKVLFNSENTPESGRWPRQVDETIGGSVRAYIKPSESLEISFDAQPEGLGILDRPDPELPQTNPKVGTGREGELEKTYVRFDADEAIVQVPQEAKISSKQRITLSSEDTCTLSATNLVELESASIKLGVNAAQGVPRGVDLHTWLSNLTVLTATGPAKINPADLAIFLTSVVSTKVTVE